MDHESQACSQTQPLILQSVCAELLYRALLIPSKSIHHRHPRPAEHLVSGWRVVALGFISQLRLQCTHKPTEVKLVGESVCWEMEMEGHGGRRERNLMCRGEE